MIAIPNMDKPKGCWDCFNYDCDHWAEHGYDNSTDCPLIEIDDEAIDIAQDIMDGCKELKERVNKDLVRCGECKWWTKQAYSIQGRCELLKMYPTSAWYCGNGERRAE